MIYTRKESADNAARPMNPKTALRHGLTLCGLADAETLFC
jgi:hypothetical protein